MKYMLMIFANGDRLAEMTAAQRKIDGEEHGAFAEYLTSRDIPFFWAVLQDQSTTTTILPGGEGRQIVTDGPHVTLKEYLGGYYIIDVADRDAAIEVARHCPAPFGLELRPIAFDAAGS